MFLLIVELVDCTSNCFSIEGIYKNMTSQLLVPFCKEEKLLLSPLECFLSLVIADSEIPMHVVQCLVLYVALHDKTY